MILQQMSYRSHFSFRCVFHLLLSVVLLLSLVGTSIGQSFKEAKRQFKTSFSSSNFERQKKSLRDLGGFERKEAYRLIEQQMLRLGSRLWKIEDAFMNMDRRKKNKSERYRWENRWTDTQKEALQIHESGLLKKMRSVFQVGAEQLRNPTKKEWLLSIVHRLGRKQPSIPSMYMLMKGKLLRPLGEIDDGDSARLLLDVLQTAERIRSHFKPRKKKHNQEIYSHSHEKSLKQYHLRKPFFKRKRILRRISIADVLRRRIYNHLSKLSSKGAIRILIEYGLNSSPLEVRAAAAYGLGFDEGSRSRNALVNRLKNEKKYQVQIELLRAIGKRGIQSAETVVQSFLKKHRTPVQYAAAHVLGRIGTMESASKLIERMEELKSGRLYHEIADALSYMTGEAFEADVDQWKKWWENHKNQSLASVSKRKMPEEKRRGKDGTDRKSSTEFYGVSLTSNNVMFVVDASLSMRDEADYTGMSAGFEPKGPGPRIPSLPEDPSRWEVAKNQLMKAIKGLDRNQMFNIIFFAGFETIWSEDHMMLATPNNKKEAFEFIQNAKLEWATVVYDALELGFNFGTVGRTPIGEQRRMTRGMTRLAPDSIIILSDGAPYLGQYDRGKRTGFVYNNIFQRINKMNQFRLLKISGISIGGKKFLQKLVNRTMYYPKWKKRPEWWIQPGVAVGR